MKDHVSMRLGEGVMQTIRHYADKWGESHAGVVTIALDRLDVDNRESFSLKEEPEEDPALA